MERNREIRLKRETELYCQRNESTPSKLKKSLSQLGIPMPQNFGEICDLSDISQEVEVFEEQAVENSVNASLVSHNKSKNATASAAATVEGLCIQYICRSLMYAVCLSLFLSLAPVYTPLCIRLPHTTHTLRHQTYSKTGMSSGARRCCSTRRPTTFTDKTLVSSAMGDHLVAFVSFPYRL